MSEAVIDVETAGFQREVLDRSREQPVVVDFWAPWCGPCQALSPVLEKLARASEGAWVLAKINTDHNPQLATDFQVRGIPAVKAFVDGEVVSEFTGMRGERDIAAWLAGIVGQKGARERLERAVTAWKSGDIAQAEALLEELAEVDATRAEAMITLAEVRLGEDVAIDDLLEDLDEMRLEPLLTARRARIHLMREVAGGADEASLRATLEADGDDHEARHRLALTLAGANRFDEALSELLELVRRDRDWQQEQGRRSMIRLFEILEPIDEDKVRHWRGELGRALYV